MTEEMGRKPWGTHELAREAGVSSSYIRQMLLDGQMNGYKVGRIWLIPDATARAWLAKREERWKAWDKRTQTE